MNIDTKVLLSDAKKKASIGREKLKTAQEVAGKNYNVAKKKVLSGTKRICKAVYDSIEDDVVKEDKYNE